MELCPETCISVGIMFFSDFFKFFQFNSSSWGWKRPPVPPIQGASRPGCVPNASWWPRGTYKIFLNHSLCPGLAVVYCPMGSHPTQELKLTWELSQFLSFRSLFNHALG